MIYINKDKNVALEISSSLIEKIKPLVSNHFPNEYGGYLVGYYAEDKRTAIITDIVIPDDYISTPISFQRSVKSSKDFFEELYLEKSIYYLGEWHSHPNGSTMYSQTDLMAMCNIVNHKNVVIDNPILMIISVNNNNHFSYSFYLYDNKKLLNYGAYRD